MCEYSIENKCKITKENCPFVYWCDKFQMWKPNKYMPKNCKVKQMNVNQYNGKYKVGFHHNGYLYVNINNEPHKLENPFNFIPDYVEIEKKDGVYIVKK